MPNQPEHVDRLQVVPRMFEGHEGSLRGWGQLYASATGKTVGGWLVNSWSDGEPYLRAQQHWFDKGEDKFYHAYFNFDIRSLNLNGEDTDVEPKRVAFIRKMTEKWEDEWMKEQERSQPGNKATAR